MWSELVTRGQAERLVIIAHSYGGVVTQSLASHPGLGAEVRARVAAVLFTDSVHYGAAKWLATVAKNYVTSDEVKTTNSSFLISDTGFLTAGGHSSGEGSR